MLSHAFQREPSNGIVIGMVPTDRKDATSLALRIVAAGEGRVRRVIAIGSRARGNPRPESDLDLVVVIETPVGDGPWTMERMAAERHRIMHAVGAPPMPTDLWVLSTDQYEEGRAVLGGIEQIADAEGVVLYSLPLTRPPVLRRAADVVRRQNTRAWLGDAVEQIASTSQAGVGAAWRSVEKAVMGLCVFHQIPADTKSNPLLAVVNGLRSKDPEIAAWLTSILQHPVDIRTARLVVYQIMVRLLGDPQMGAYLDPLFNRLPPTG